MGRKGDRTRRRLLEAAFEVIRRRGFQASGLGEILSAVGLTKGALYHHFGDKTSLGWAVVEEIISEIIEERWIAPLQAAEEDADPLGAIIVAMRTTAEELDDQEIELGCPLGNLAAEMSALDPGFALRISAIYENWRDALSTALSSARPPLTDDPPRIATFMVSALSGALAQAKTTARRQVLLDGIAEVEAYLKGLGSEATISEPQYTPASSTGEIEDYLL